MATSTVSPGQAEVCRELLCRLAQITNKTEPVNPEWLTGLTPATRRALGTPEQPGGVSVAFLEDALADALSKYDARYSSGAVANAALPGTHRALVEPSATAAAPKVGGRYMAEWPQEWGLLPKQVRDFLLALSTMDPKTLNARAAKAERHGMWWPTIVQGHRAE